MISSMAVMWHFANRVRRIAMLVFTTAEGPTIPARNVIQRADSRRSRRSESEWDGELLLLACGYAGRVLGNDRDAAVSSVSLEG